MSLTDTFIRRLERLGEGDLAQLRRLSGHRIDARVQGFDLFVGLWWPLRERSPRAPRRDTSWLIAKIYSSFPIGHTSDESMTLATVLGRLEPRSGSAQCFRRRFDALLQARLGTIEPHLRWALSNATGRGSPGQARSLNWTRLLDDLSAWDRGTQHRYRRDIRDMWAADYLQARVERREETHAHRNPHDSEPHPIQPEQG